MITLKQARKNAGLKMDDVAKTLGISAPSSSKYETGQSPIPEHKLLMLCELYGVKTVDLKLRRVVDKIFAIPHKPPTPFIEIAQDTGELDDRVCLYYVIERVGDCIEFIETTSDAEVSELYEFYNELIHAVGANYLERRNNG
jgi:transcriptional regulator with XRE-family HTH domain